MFVDVATQHDDNKITLHVNARDTINHVRVKYNANVKRCYELLMRNDKSTIREYIETTTLNENVNAIASHLRLTNEQRDALYAKFVSRFASINIDVK